MSCAFFKLIPTDSSITSREIFVPIFLANSRPLLCKIEMKYHSNIFRKFAYALFFGHSHQAVKFKNTRCYDGEGCSGVLVWPNLPLRSLKINSSVDFAVKLIAALVRHVDWRPIGSPFEITENTAAT